MARLIFILSAALFLMQTGCPGPAVRQVSCETLVFDFTPKDTDIPVPDDNDQDTPVEETPTDDAVAADNDLAPEITMVQWGSDSADGGTSIAISPSGAIFVTGGTAGSLEGNTNLGQSDIFITALDTNLNRTWTHQFGTELFDEGFTITFTENSLYLAGSTKAYRDPMENVIGTMFTARYLENGNELWMREWGSSSQEFPSKIALDGNGGIYITGWTYGNLTPGANQGLSDIFVTKFSEVDGSQQWVNQWGTGFLDAGYGVLSANGRIYATGWTYGNLAGDNEGFSDIFLSCLNADDGTRLWTTQWGSYNADAAHTIAAGTDGTIFVAGSTNGSLGGYSNQGGKDNFIMKFAPSGAQEWVLQFGSAGDDVIYGTAVLSDGSILVAGGTTGIIGSGNVSNGNIDIFLSKISPQGFEEKTLMWGTEANEQANAIIADQSGTIYLTGWTEGSLANNSSGLTDIFVIKIKNLIKP